MSEEKSSEAKLFTARNLEEANALRLHLLNSSRHLWLFVARESGSSGRYNITACNEHGGRLPEGMVVLLRSECQLFITKHRESLTSDDVDDDAIKDVTEL